MPSSRNSVDAVVQDHRAHRLRRHHDRHPRRRRADRRHSDFGTQEAWFYVTLLTIGYMVSRGLAKSGSRDFYDDNTDGGPPPQPVTPLYLQSLAQVLGMPTATVTRVTLTALNGDRRP